MIIFRILFLLLLTSSAAIAAPGAHGPNGEHLDAPGGNHVHGDMGPRIDTFTESFELVGHLQDGELSILIDRYETNEPVLNATLDVELNGVTVPAKFHADHGDYAVADANFLKSLDKPGKHALIFTLSAGEESDLLEGTLEVKAEEQDHGHGHDTDADHGHSFSLRTWAIAGVLLSVVLVAMVIAVLRRKSDSDK